MRYEILIKGTHNLYSKPPIASFDVKGKNPLLFLSGSVFWTHYDPDHTPDPPKRLIINVLVDGVKKGKAYLGKIDKTVYSSVVPMFIPLRGLKSGTHEFKLEYAKSYVPDQSSGSDSNFCLAIFDFDFE